MIAVDEAPIRARIAAERLSVSVWKVRELVRLGELRGMSVSDARNSPLLVFPSSIEDYLSRRVRSAA